VRAILFVLGASVCLAQETTAEKLIEAGHWKRARALVERRLREAPADANAIFLSSQIRNAFGDRVSPPELAEKAVQLDGGVARYHRQLAEVQGVMAQRSGIFQQLMLARRFRKEIEAALTLDRSDVQALRDLLEFYLLAPALVGGDPKQAGTVVQQIASIDAAEGFLAAARIAEFHKDPARMETKLRAAAEVRPPSYKALMAMAHFYLAPERRNEAEAEALGRSAVALDSGRIEAYCILAATYAGRGEWSALEASLSAAARAVPDDPAPCYRAAERLLSDGREPARAERYLRLYLAQEAEGNQPTAADAHWQLGLALRAQGQRANAIREWKIALQLDPESPAARELKRSPSANLGASSERTALASRRNLEPIARKLPRGRTAWSGDGGLCDLRQPFSIMTSVDLITARTASPFLSPRPSALARVITLSTMLSPTRTVIAAMMVPNLTSSTIPGSWFLAERDMRSLYHNAASVRSRARRLTAARAS
jgi:Tfp pilus assembly protein PilF